MFSRVKLVFLLTAYGKQSYFGVKKWIEDQSIANDGNVFLNINLDVSQSKMNHSLTLQSVSD
jgi:hypothetical protein